MTGDSIHSVAGIIASELIRMAPENVYGQPRESEDFDGAYGIHYDGPINLDELARSILEALSLDTTG